MHRPVNRVLYLLFSLLPALPALGSGPASQPPKPPAQTARRPPPSDIELERAIRERFARSKIAADKFTVRVQGGIATIEGRTDVIQRKATATRLARLAGAREVRNRVEVSEKAREKAKANLAEGRRRAQVTRGQARTQPR